MRCLPSLRPAMVFLLSLALASSAQALDRGHQIILDNGLQIQAMVATNHATFNADNFRAANFTTINLGKVENGNYSYLDQVPELKWGRWALPPRNSYTPAGSAPYNSRLISFQYGDEAVLSDSAVVTDHANWLSGARYFFPSAVSYTNWSMHLNTDAVLRNYMQVAQPDIVSATMYPFVPNQTALQARPQLYSYLSRVRALALEGHPGSNGQPIPYGLYLQTFSVLDPNYWQQRMPSESEMRLQQNMAWAFGYTFANAFVYTALEGMVPQINPAFFDNNDDNQPNARLAQYAELNRQSRNLGTVLTHLVSTDVRMARGKHLHESQRIVVDNDAISGLADWTSGAVPSITGVRALNRGPFNDRLPGDVVIGAFRGLEGTPEAQSDDVYFMLVNGLSDPNASIAQTAQRILLDFDFAGTQFTGLQRLSRNTGLFEDVSLLWRGDSRWRLDFTLEGGTGDLFRIVAGSQQVPEPSGVVLLVLLGGLGLGRRRMS